MVYRDRSWKDALGCPRCGFGLKNLATEEMVIARCDRCKGTWLDSEAVEQLIAACRAPTEILRDESDDESENRASLLRCPVCADELKRREFLEVSDGPVDECLDCGSWFDAGELKRAARFLRSKEGAESLARLRPIFLDG